VWRLYQIQQKRTSKIDKKDVVVVWEGTKDAGRNETRDGLNHTQAFVRKNIHTMLY